MGAPTTTQEAVALITPEVRETYARDGVAILRQALHPEWLLLLQLGLDRVMGDSGQKKHLFYDGTENEWITSLAVVMTRIFLLTGTTSG